MIIKLKDLLKETDITIRNPHTHKTIKARSALSSDDPKLVKKARKALGMSDKDKKDKEKCLTSCKNLDMLDDGPGIPPDEFKDDLNEEEIEEAIYEKVLG